MEAGIAIHQAPPKATALDTSKATGTTVDGATRLEAASPVTI